VLVWFRTKGDVAVLGAGFKVSRATAYRYRDEGIQVLTAQAPELHEASSATAPMQDLPPDQRGEQGSVGPVLSVLSRVFAADSRTLASGIGGPVIDPRPPTRYRPWQDQRLDQLPEPILDPPLLHAPCHDRHD
jgi:hypothetical protein